jgi:osmoprotectant transport system permease protein
MSLRELQTFVGDRLDELVLRTSEHIMLAGVSTLVAVVIGIAIGIYAFRNERWRSLILAAVGILQTIPGLAMLVFLMTVLNRIGFLPAFLALTLYALLPIVRNTLTGLANVSKTTILAAEGLGLNARQQLFYVRLPIAAPFIMAGIRTATVIGIGLATLAAFIGGGGLGEFINRGLALSNTRLILLGAIPAAVLAILADLTLSAAEWGLKPVSRNNADRSLTSQIALKRCALALPIVLLAGSLCLYSISHGPLAKMPVRIGTKQFSEQIILGELMAQVIEGKTHLKVERRFDLGGTMICHGALVNNEIDMYPEYTGTSLLAVLHEPLVANPAQALSVVSKDYDERFGVRWMAPFGFNNTWALIVKADNPKFLTVSTISGLEPIASHLEAGLTAEFAERDDGYLGLSKSYNLHFGRVRDLDPNLVYIAISLKQVDLAAGNSTDGRIPTYGLKMLTDDKHFFPPYQGAPIVREDFLAAHPDAGAALNSLGNQIDDKTMQTLNFQVDGLKLSPAAVAKAFLQSRKLID